MPNQMHLFEARSEHVPVWPSLPEEARRTSVALLAELAIRCARSTPPTARTEEPNHESSEDRAAAPAA